jgi:hypothetical protein
MADGPGKYGRECEAAHLAADADTTLLIVLNGHSGSGFSMSTKLLGGVPLSELPALLRGIAEQLEVDVRRRVGQA